MICFAMPHELLGEVIGAAIVVRSGMAITLTGLREFAIQSSINHKWLPEVMVLLPDIPKGPTGKPMRIGLADKLQLPQLTHGDTDQCTCWDVVDVPGSSKLIEATPAPHLLQDTYILAEQDVMNAPVHLPDPSTTGLSQHAFQSTLRNFLIPAVRHEIAKMIHCPSSSVPLASPLVSIGLASMTLMQLGKMVQSCTGVVVPAVKLMDMTICEIVEHVISREGSSPNRSCLA